MIIVGVPVFWLFGQSYEECGTRMLFLSLTSILPSKSSGANGKGQGILEAGESQTILVGSDGEKGSGAYCVDSAVKRLNNEKKLKALKAKGATDVIWEHTMEIFRSVGS